MPRYQDARERSAAVSENAKRAEATAAADAETTRAALESHYLLVIQTWTARTDATAPSTIDIPIDSFSKSTLEELNASLRNAGYATETINETVLHISAP